MCISSAALSSLALSTLAIWCHIVRSRDFSTNVHIYTVGQKRATLLLCTSSPIIDQFSKFFHWHTLQTICNNVIIIDPHIAFKTRAKEDHEAFITWTVEEVEEGIKSNHLGPAFKAIKVLTGNKPTQVMSFVNKVDGSPCTSLEETLHRWHEHFTAAHLITHRVLRVPIWTRKRTPLRGTLIPQ